MEQKPAVKKVHDMSEKRDATKLYMLKTKFGSFVGKEQLDDDGGVMGYKEVIEMQVMAMNNGIGIAAILTGELLEFPEDDYVLFELDAKSMYAKKYKEEMNPSSLVIPQGGIIKP
jgi:hypothetical protein